MPFKSTDTIESAHRWVGVARGEVLPAFFAMANSHQAFSNRDVRRVFLSRFAPHDIVADRRTHLLKSDPTKEAGSIPPEEVRRTNERTLTGAL